MDTDIPPLPEPSEIDGARWGYTADDMRNYGVEGYSAGVAAERERWEPVSWQQRYLCPDEGPSIWQHCNDSDAAIFAKRADYELRRVYAVRA